MLMAYCFYEHGILPEKYITLSRKDKALMLAAIHHFTKDSKKNNAIGAGKNVESLI